MRGAGFSLCQHVPFTGVSVVLSAFSPFFSVSWGCWGSFQSVALRPNFYHPSVCFPPFPPFLGDLREVCPFRSVSWPELGRGSLGFFFRRRESWAMAPAEPETNHQLGSVLMLRSAFAEARAAAHARPSSGGGGVDAERGGCCFFFGGGGGIICVSIFPAPFLSIFFSGGYGVYRVPLFVYLCLVPPFLKVLFLVFWGQSSRDTRGSHRLPQRGTSSALEREGGPTH